MLTNHCPPLFHSPFPAFSYLFAFTSHQGYDHFSHVCMFSCSVLSNSLQPHGLYNPPGSTVRGTSQARMLEWVAVSFFRGSSRPRDRTCIFCISYIDRWILYHHATREAQTAHQEKLRLYYLQPPSIQDKNFSKRQTSFFCWTNIKENSFTTPVQHLAFCVFSNSSIPTSSTLLKSSGGSGGFTWCLSTVTTRCSMSWTDTKEGEWPVLYKQNPTKHTRVCEGRWAVSFFHGRQGQPVFGQHTLLLRDCQKCWERGHD